MRCIFHERRLHCPIRPAPAPGKRGTAKLLLSMPLAALPPLAYSGRLF
jgi:hypothetical protein